MKSVELVGKIGSMALINKSSNIPDYTLIARLSAELRPGYIWVTSGATEIGRLDYIKRCGKELEGTEEHVKADYSAQGQTILMSCYREYVKPEYNIRQILVEHQHFNNEEKRENLRNMLLRCQDQNAIPIINYNDAVCAEESRKMEIMALTKTTQKVVQCIDNDETATQIACLVKAKNLLILTSAEGIYKNVNEKSGIIEKITGNNIEEVLQNVNKAQQYCHGASRIGANGAKAKLEYIKEAVKCGTKVIVGSAKYSIKDLMSGTAPATRIGVNL